MYNNKKLINIGIYLIFHAHIFFLCFEADLISCQIERVFSLCVLENEQTKQSHSDVEFSEINPWLVSHVQ